MKNKTLYIVGTPIGNLEDISFRAIETLKSVELILCEDTRVTRKLLDKYSIQTKTMSLHQHSKDEKINKILAENISLAYVTDAGTPGISDPGNKLVELAIKQDYTVSPIPGPSAIISVLSVSGFPTDKFTFLGFMPKKGKSKVFEQIRDSNITIAFYESTHRIIKTLNEMNEFIPDRQILVAREITKKFETIYRGTISEILPELEKQSKGEFVVVVEGR